MSYQPRFPKHKLTRADGEFYLWHALQHLQNVAGSEYYLDGRPDAIKTIRTLLDSLLGEEAA